MKVKLSPMAKISKIIMTGRNEENVNLQKWKNIKTHIHKDTRVNHTPRSSQTLLSSPAGLYSYKG